jgi:hypothetical protein
MEGSALEVGHPKRLQFVRRAFLGLVSILALCAAFGLGVSLRDFTQSLPEVTIVKSRSMDECIHEIISITQQKPITTNAIGDASPYVSRRFTVKGV